MTYQAIQGTPLSLTLFAVQLGDADKDPSHHARPLGATANETLLNLLLTFLPNDTAQALKDVLSTPLDQVFQMAWTNSIGAATGMVEQSILAAKPNAYAFNVGVPSTGTLNAEVGLISPDMLNTVPPGTIGQQLLLSFALPGFKAFFKATTDSAWGQWADPAYTLTFDAEILIELVVPNDPRIPIGFRASFLTHNVQAGADNFEATLIGIEDLIVAWLNNATGGSGGRLPDQQVPLGTMQIPDLLNKIQTLSTAFTSAFDLGFTVLGVQINPSPSPPAPLPAGPTVEFDLTFPFLKGPTVRNALASPVPSLFGAQIATSSPEVKPGGVLGVAGAYFPATQPSELTITWDDTVIGSQLAATELQWVQSATAPADGSDALPPGGSTMSVGRTSKADGLNTFTARGLSAGTPYAFRARDHQFPIFFATDWGPWTNPPLMTAPTNQVQLVLAGTVVGAGVVQNDGSLTTMITVPANLAPGTYILNAVLGGITVARAPLEVVAQLSPSLVVVDANGLAHSFATVIGPAAVTLGGSAFGANAGVSFLLDTTSGMPLGGANVDSLGGFSATITWPFGVTGSHKIVATQTNGNQASVDIWAEALPR